MKKNALKKAIAVLAAAALLCSSAAAYAAQVSGPSGIETAAAQVTQAPVSITRDAYRLMGKSLYVQFRVKNNADDITKTERKITIQKRYCNPNSGCGSWSTIVSESYLPMNGETFVWAGSLNFSPDMDEIRAVVDVRVTYASGAVETVSETFTF